MEADQMNVSTFTWTQNELVEHAKRFETFQSFMNHVQEEMALKGRVICEIRVNGSSLNEEEEMKWKDFPLNQIADVSITAQAPQDLILDSIASTQEYLVRLTHAIETSANFFRGTSLEKAHEFYQSCLEGTQWFVKMVGLLKGAYENASKASLQGWNEHEEILKNVLLETLDAYEKKNYILMADLMEYDLLNNFQGWGERLDEIREQITKPQSLNR